MKSDPAFSPVPKLLSFIIPAILLCTVSLSIFSQEPAANTDRRGRYVSSAPGISADAKPATIRFAGNSQVRTSPKILKTLEADDYDTERKTFDLINQKRADRGLTKLEWNEQVARLARIHSQNMAKYDFFSHAGLNGRMVDERATDFGAIDWEAIGENIAYCQGFTNPADFVVGRWMLSTGHRENLLNAIWTETGIGMAKTVEGKYFFTQVFIVK